MQTNIDKKVDIRLVEWGLANNFGDFIEIHKDLPNFPEIYEPILLHELSHTDKTFSMHDFRIDFFRDKKLNYRKLYKFMLVRPKTWIQFLPLYWQRNKGFVYDINLSLIYLMIFSVIGLNILFWFYLL